MRRVRAKYPINIGRTLIMKGVVGDVVTLEQARKSFPGIDYKEGSKQLSVLFPGILSPCIVHKDQVEFV